MAEEEESEEMKKIREEAELVAEIRECFDLFDKEKTGTIELHKLGHALRGLGINLTSTEMEGIMEEFTATGLVPFDRFFEITSDKIKDQDLFDSLKNAFTIFDPEEEGYLSADRFKRWMMTLGNPLTESEAKEIVKLGDIACNGTILYDDLIAIFVSELK